MYLCDVNVLVNAFRPDAPEHATSRSWLEGVLADESSYGVSEHVLSGFVRVVTHPKVFAQPDSFADALTFADAVRGQPHAVLVRPGPGHWSIFCRLGRESDGRGDLVADAYLAALAIESGCEWVSFDRDFSRFRGLRWSHPRELLDRDA